MNMRFGIGNRWGVVALLVALVSFVTSCTTPTDEPIFDDGYGYAQFKLYKEASYTPAEEVGTKAIVSQLEKLADAHKVKVTLVYGETTIVQTLRLNGADGEAAEWGLRSEKLQLLAGEYRLITFMLYDSEDRELYSGAPQGNGSFTVTSGAVTVHDIVVNVAPRGKVQFTLRKDMSDFEQSEGTRAVTRQYTFDEIKEVNITIKETSRGTTTLLEELPCKFDLHFFEDDDLEDGYQTSSILCDTLIWLPQGNYIVTRYEAYDSEGSLLETNNTPTESTFAIKDNQTTKANINITLYEADAYIQDYIVLKKIWESLDGDNWYYVGEEFKQGINWDFNKDVDLWGDQPGVKLHANGRVAFIDISSFGVRGELSPEIGKLTDLVELYIGTHNDTNFTYDPTLDHTKSREERSRNRMKYHGEWLRKLHTPIQMSEPCARALAENGISVPEMSLYESMSEGEVIDRESGAQLSFSLMDSSFGTLCNGLTKIPNEIGNCTKLEYLYVANSAIESFPASLENLTSLTDLEIYNCPNLTDFPMSITQLPTLKSVNISNNAQWSAESIYEGLNALAEGASKESVEILYCRQNNLEELPASFKNMKKLGLLDLAYNKISKVHPLGKDVSFVQLYLDFNQISSLPRDEEGYFCGYDDVENFSINYNRLTKVPNIFDANSLFTMASVSFGGNQIDGFEDGDDYKGIRVETFTLSQNLLTSYPMELAKSNSMVNYIILRANLISEVPEGSFIYRNSVDLTSLDLSYNEISDLPSDMHSANLPYLYGIDLSFNSFKKFPLEPLDSAGLTVLAVRSQRDAEGHRTLDEWPTGIGSHRGLRGLYLGSNNLGYIQDNISTLIYYLDISDNPNIIFDASDICYAWSVGAYILIYDRSQNIINCNAMLN